MPIGRADLPAPAMGTAPNLLRKFRMRRYLLRAVRADLVGLCSTTQLICLEITKAVTSDTYLTPDCSRNSWSACR